MARDPGSVWSPLPEAGAPDGKTKTQFIVHSTGDNRTAAATRKYFAGATLNESTFIVGWGPDDPTLQIMDSTDIADANGSANGRGISVEVVGDGVGGYNAWQRSELIRLGLWARSAHPGILPRVIPSEPEAGFGWHVMFGAPGPWAKAAKVCPGKQRIKELTGDIFPAIFAGGLTEEDEMAGYAEAINEIRGLMQNVAPAMGRVDARTYGMEALLAKVVADGANDLTEADVIEAARKGVEQGVGDIGGIVRTVVLETLGDDNADQADEIVDRLVSRLAS